MLEKIYVEFYDMFKFETFHLGADEVNIGCWNKSKIITDYMDANNMPRTEEGAFPIQSAEIGETRSTQGFVTIIP